MSGFILQNFSEHKKDKFPIGKIMYIYFEKPVLARKDDIIIESEMTIADLLIKIGFFKNIKDYENFNKFYNIYKNGKKLPYTTKILGSDDTLSVNIQDGDRVTIFDPQHPLSTDYGRKQSSKRKSGKRSSRKRSSRKRKSRKRSSRKRKSGKRKSRK